MPDVMQMRRRSGSIASQEGIFQDIEKPPPSKMSRTKALVVIVVGILLVAYFYPTTPKVVEPAAGKNTTSKAAPVLVGEKPTGSVEWQDCGVGSLQCGAITVPLDYFNESAGTASIAVSRRRATKSPRRGSLFINPGGPGGSGYSVLLHEADDLATMFGEDWDIVGFDPRGIGLTKPKVHCFPSALTSASLVANTVYEKGFTIPNTSDPSDPHNYWALADQWREWLGVRKTQIAMCSENMDVDHLRFMGTASVVRDLELMARVLDGPEAKVNFWGLSYGSIIGAYLVNMLPNRVGYVTIDGVVNPVTWSGLPSHLWHRGWVEYAEDTYGWFLETCSKAGPEVCPLSRREGEHATEIMGRIEAFIASLAESPLPVESGPRPGYLTAGAVRGAIYKGLITPFTWRNFSSALALAMPGSPSDFDPTDLFAHIARPLPDPDAGDAHEDLGRLGVTCNDSPVTEAVGAEELAKNSAEGIKSRVWELGAMLTDADGGCEFWPTKGKQPERFTGPFNATLEHPMLIISNTADPITPLTSGLLVNEMMPTSSRMVIQNGPGHTSVFAPSICTLKALKAYYAGIPPQNGTLCEVTFKPFWTEIDDGGETLPAEDRKLFDAALNLARYFTGG